MEFCEIRLTHAPVSPPPHPERSSAGAIVDFYGVVRPIEAGRSIEGIDYEFHERMAEHELRRIVESAKDGLLGCRLIHRVGFVPAGEVSLFLRVATMRRAAGYRLSQHIVEALKARVPIWKRPRFSDAPPSVALAQ